MKKRSIKSLIIVVVVVFGILLFNVNTSAAAMSGSKRLSGRYSGAYNWEFNASYLAYYSESSGYIYSQHNSSISGVKCNPIAPGGTACKIEPSQSSKSYTKSTATYKYLVNVFYFTRGLGYIYLGSQYVSFSVNSPGPGVRSVNLTVDPDSVEISEPFIDIELEGLILDE